MRRIARIAHAVADGVGVLLLSGMFGAFILQIVFRYVVRDPLPWTLEACLIAWLWTVFWGAAFLVPERDHVRFDILYANAGPRLRRVFALLSALAIAGVFAVSLPRVWDYISFMSIESSSSLHIRLDRLFFVYMIFAVAIIARYGWRAIRLARGADPDRLDGTRPATDAS